MSEHAPFYNITFDGISAQDFEFDADIISIEGMIVNSSDPYGTLRTILKTIKTKHGIEDASNFEIMLFLSETYFQKLEKMIVENSLGDFESGNPYFKCETSLGPIIVKPIEPTEMEETINDGVTNISVQCMPQLFEDLINTVGSFKKLIDVVKEENLAKGNPVIGIEPDSFLNLKKLAFEHLETLTMDIDGQEIKFFPEVKSCNYPKCDCDKV